MTKNLTPKPARVRKGQTLTRYVCLACHKPITVYANPCPKCKKPNAVVRR